HAFLRGDVIPQFEKGERELVSHDCMTTCNPEIGFFNKMAMAEVDGMGRHLPTISSWDLYFWLIVLGGRPELVNGVSHLQFGSR
ncbi:MAG: hypothetical protein H0W49_15565, partial [Nitrospirales bacterium]|nr:hypothetical protein [Nitrospirales bacterium]